MEWLFNVCAALPHTHTHTHSPCIFNQQSSHHHHEYHRSAEPVVLRLNFANNGLGARQNRFYIDYIEQRIEFK